MYGRMSRGLVVLAAAALLVPAAPAAAAPAGALAPLSASLAGTLGKATNLTVMVH